LKNFRFFATFGTFFDIIYIRGENIVVLLCIGGDKMSRVALIGENSVEYVDKLLDIWNNGDCAVLLDWRIPLQAAIQMMREAEVCSCYIEKKLLKASAVGDISDIAFIAYEVADISPKLLPNEVRKKYRENYSCNEAVVIYSSGTTGKTERHYLNILF